MKMNPFLLLFTLSYLVVNHKVVSEVTQGYNQCKGFFYKNTPPEMDPAEIGWGKTERICQKYQQNYFFATQYSTDWRIPIYSAYELPSAQHASGRYCRNRQRNRPAKWLIEPQIGSPNPGDFSANMAAEKDNQHAKQFQAINKDYEDTGFDRGHLNPAAYHCDEARSATFTLTNCVPQDPYFNRVIWYDLEVESKKLMKEMCHSIPGARSYFVTGAVPRNKMIPNEEHDQENSFVRDYKRVSVPEYMWTAACCDTSNAIDPNDADKGFSFAYYGKNNISAHSVALTVSALNSADFFKKKYVKIFTDECFEDSTNSKNAMNKISQPISLAETRALDGERFMKNETLPLRKRAKMLQLREAMPNVKEAVKKAVENNLEWDVRVYSVGVYIRPKQVVKFRKSMDDVNMDLVLKSTDIANIDASWLDRSELDENFISNPLNDAAIEEDESTSDEELDYYQITPKIYNDKVTADGASCLSTYTCGDHGENYHWCWTGWTKWDYCCAPDSKCQLSDYVNKPQCNVGTPGHERNVACSMRSSTVTINGNSCTSNECGLHGYPYYWCYTKSGYNYCCPPWNKCSYKKKNS